MNGPTISDKAREGPGAISAARAPGVVRATEAVREAEAVGAVGTAIVVGLGEAVVGGVGAELVVYGLGSCIGLAIWSGRLRVGILCHIVLPSSSGMPVDPSIPAKYADSGVAWAVDALVVKGARREELVAKLAGGAKVLAFPLATDIGRQNTVATLAALDALGVQVQGSMTGGTIGRTLWFCPETGIVEVRPLNGVRTRL